MAMFFEKRPQGMRIVQDGEFEARKGKGPFTKRRFLYAKARFHSAWPCAAWIGRDGVRLGYTLTGCHVFDETVSG